MGPERTKSRMKPFLFLILTGLVAVALPARADDRRLPPALDKVAPEGVEDLRAIQKQTTAVLEKVIPCTVGVRVRGASGSGVLVSEDGYVLTAGHVAGAPGVEVTVILSDGRRVKGKTLGVNRTIDSGLIKITDEGKWPFVEMGDSTKLRGGQWVIATGHPNGYKNGRPPPVRFGRVLDANYRIVLTDCTLVGGDSGGPLFDMEGKVVGIHSRIAGPVTANLHVPAFTYGATWEALTKSEVLGGAYAGVRFTEEEKDCKLEEVTEGSGSEKAGLKAGDVITRFDGHKVRFPDDVRGLLANKKPGDEVAVVVRRGGEDVTLKLVLGRRRG